ncbi:MAG: hypothetical protein ACRDOE_01245 [Streptosporangiaceae bacterium]
MPDRFYDRDGQPITEDRWADLFFGAGFARVARHELDAGVVSTIWWGFDPHASDRPGGNPLIFETVVFDREGDVVELYRYRSEGEAIAGHAVAVDHLRERAS